MKDVARQVDMMEMPLIKKWLEQFELADRYLAQHVIRRLRYVSFSEVERWIQEALTAVIEEIDGSTQERQKIAVFPVAKPFLTKFNQDKQVKPTNDSGGRFGHSLKNIERQLPRRIEVSPRTDSMRASRVRHIIFIDDFVGTGSRFVDSWMELVDPTIKAWCSRGWCQVWLLAFAGHALGVKRIVRKVRALKVQNVRIANEIDQSFIVANTNLKRIAEKYGSKGKDMGLGFGRLATPFVFQYGCPNNAISMLWARASNSGAGWKALFPDRGIPPDLYPLFEGKMMGEGAPEELWMARHYSAAVGFLDKMRTMKAHHSTVVFLALLNARKPLKYIRAILILTEPEFNQLKNELVDSGLVDVELNVTEFGKDVLRRIGKASRKTRGINNFEGNHFPSTYLGFQREV